MTLPRPGRRGLRPVAGRSPARPSTASLRGSTAARSAGSASTAASTGAPSGPAEGETIERLVGPAVELGIPIVGRVASSGADVNEGVAALHAWGRVAGPGRRAGRRARRCSPWWARACRAGAAARPGRPRRDDRRRLRLRERPDAVAEFTGVTIDRVGLGGGGVHDAHRCRLAGRRRRGGRPAGGGRPAVLPAAQPPRRAPRSCAHGPVDRPCARAAGPRCPPPPGRPTTCAPSWPTCSTRARSWRCGPATPPTW